MVFQPDPVSLCAEPGLCGFARAFELVLGPFLPAGYFALTPHSGTMNTGLVLFIF